MSGRANWGFVFAILAALVLWFVMTRTIKGFEMIVNGECDALPDAP